MDAAQARTPCWLNRGSLFATLMHLAGAQWSWRAALQEGKMPGYPLAFILYVTQSRS